MCVPMSLWETSRFPSAPRSRIGWPDCAMPLLYYWRRDNYVRDLDLGAGYHLNQEVMHEVARGDRLWAFTRTADGRYVLAAELIVQAKTKNRPDFRYGTYRV